MGSTVLDFTVPIVFLFRILGFGKKKKEEKKTHRQKSHFSYQSRDISIFKCLRPNHTRKKHQVSNKIDTEANSQQKERFCIRIFSPGRG